MGVKDFLVKHWKWVAIVIAVLVGIALISNLLTSLYSAGMGVVAWYANRQRQQLGEQYDQSMKKAEQISQDLQAEIIRQNLADTDLEIKVTAVREAETVDLWDTQQILDRPKLDD